MSSPLHHASSGQPAVVEASVAYYGTLSCMDE